MRVSTITLLALVAALTPGCGGIVSGCSKVAVTATSSTAKVGVTGAAKVGTTAAGTAKFGAEGAGMLGAERAGLGAAEGAGAQLGSGVRPLKPASEAARVEEGSWAERILTESAKKVGEEMLKQGAGHDRQNQQPSKR